MTRHITFQTAGAAAFGVLLFFSIAQAKEERVYIAPPVVHARTYAAHVEDTQNKVTVGVDPYDNAAKANIFTVEYLKYGLLPVQLIVSNDGDDAISLRDLRAELVTGKKAELEALAPDEVLRRLFQHGQIQPHVSGSSPLPIPLPHKSRTAQQEKAQAEIERARFGFIAVEPHTTRAGFLFFDAGLVHDAITRSYVYVSGVRNARGQELLYFELPLKTAEPQGSAP